MSATSALTYVGPFDEVEVAGHVVKRGESCSFPAALVGRAASTETVIDDEGNESEVTDPGEGLLAQADNWQLTPREKPLAELTPTQLKKLAEKRGVDLDGVTAKADIIAAIENGA